MDDNTSRITNLVHDLIVAILPQSTPPTTVQSCHSYSLRLLSSRINNKSVEDESLVRSCIQKRLQKRAEEQNLNKQTLNGLSLRVQELLQNLNRKKVLRRTLSVCYLLTRVSENTDPKQSSIISPLDGIIKTKQSEKWKPSNENSLRRGQMEIEPNSGQTQSTTFLNSKPEPQSNLSKLITKVTNKGNSTVSENDLLRDTLFAFQGIDGNYVYYSAHDNGFVIKPTITLSDPVKKMILQLCELGWLFKKVVSFIEEANVESRGLVHQCLCYALKEELNEYYRLIAVLENLRDSDEAIASNKGSIIIEEGSNEKSLNLRKLYLWSLEPMERLKWMCIFCDANKKNKGSSIISTIYGYTKQGSPPVQMLVNRVLKYVLAPFSNFLKQWVYNGELSDQFGEFFITMNPYIKDEDLWNNKYILNKEMIPAFIDLQIAEKILTTGKSVNFLRRCCNVNDWYLNIDFIDLSSAVISNVNQTLNFTEFKDWVLHTHELTSKALLLAISEKFRLVQHFEAIKRFLLFGQGDFIQCLMDQLIHELSKPATSIYRHNLNTLLDTAIRSSNAQYMDNDFVGRVEVKLLDPSPGDNGWDIFSLTYRVDSPLNTILNTGIMNGYLRLFNFLWRVKRIEYSLNLLWYQHKKGARLMDRMKEFKTHIHRCNLIRNEMNHFVGNLLNYLTVEVVEGSWKIFMDELRDAKDLNDVINYHEKFVNSMLDKTLLTQKNEKIYKQMVRIFDLIYRFKCTQEILIASLREEDQKRLTRKNKRDMMEILGENLDESGQYDSERRDENSLEIENADEFPVQTIMKKETLHSLQVVSKDYQQAFTEFMELIKDDNLVGKMRFLSFRLDFNEYYTSMNPQAIWMRDRNLEEFKIDKKPPPPSGGFEGGNQSYENYNTRIKASSPPQYTSPSAYEQQQQSDRVLDNLSVGKTGYGDRMITEEPEEEKSRTFPTEYSSYKTTNTNQFDGFPPSVGLRDIDLGIRGNTGGPLPSTSRISQMNDTIDRINAMVRNRPQLSEIGGFGAGNIGGGLSSDRLDTNNSFLRSFNYGDSNRHNQP